MKRCHSLFLTALCLLAACEPSPPPLNDGRVEINLGSQRTFELTSSNIAFTDQKVCDSSTSSTQTIVVHNEETVARKITFVEATTPFVLMSIDGASPTSSSFPYTLGPGNDVSFVVKFNPLTPATYTGYLNILNDGSSPLGIPLSGKGTGPRLEMSPSSLSLSLPTETSDAGVSDAGVSGDAGTPMSSAVGTIHLTNGGNTRLTSLSLGPVSAAFSARLSRPVTMSDPLEPGGTVDLVVTFNPTTSGSIFTDTLTVSSDDPCAPVLRIPLTGSRSLDPTPVFNPTALSFSEQEVGTLSAPQSVKVFNGGGSVLTVDSLSLQGTGDAGTPFIVSPSGPFSLAPGEGRDLSVKFNPTTAGRQQATLQLVSNSKSPSPSLALSGDAVVAAPLVIDTSSLVFSNQVSGQEKTQEVSVENPGPSPVTVTATVATTDTSLTLKVNPSSSFTLAPNAIQKLVVSVKPSSTAVTGPLSGQLTLSSGATTSPSRQTIIPISGNIVQTRVVPSATTLSFNDQLVGAPVQTREIVLQNPSTLPVRVTGVAAGSLDPFSVTGLPKTIPAESSEKVTISFAPTSSKQWDATLQLTSDASVAIDPVKLSGKAIAPVLSIVTPSPLNLDFGTQIPGTRIPKTVTLKNEGDADLLLSKVDTLDPTHFTIEGLVTSGVIKPQGTRSFTVVFNAQEQGVNNTVLRFYLDSSLTPLASPQINLSATSSSPVASFTPSDQVDFGIRTVGGPPLSMKVRISNDTGANEPLELVQVSIKNNSSEFTLVDGPYTGEVAAGAYRDVWLKFEPSSTDKESYSDELYIVYRGATTQVSSGISIPLKGRAMTSVLSVFDKLPFDAVELTKTKSLQLDIANKGNTTLRISSISISGGPSPSPFLLGRLDWPKDVEPGKQMTISISFTPTTLAAVTADLVITSNATGGNIDKGTTKVLMSGQGATAGASFERRDLAFGEIPIGETSTRHLLITNIGSAPLEISQPNPVGPFSVKLPDTGRWPVSIPAQDSYSFPIVFTPTSESSETQGMIFLTNDKTQSSVTITLQGKGGRPQLLVDPTLSFGEAMVSSGGSEYKEVQKTLALTNVGAASLVIRSLGVTGNFCVAVDPSSSSCVQNTASDYSLTIAPQQQANLTLRATPKSLNESGTLTLTTNLGKDGTSSKTVDLLVGAGGVVIQGGALDFGDCDMDDPTAQVDKAVNLWTTGMDDQVTDVKPFGEDVNDFKVVSATQFEVTAKDGARLMLRFKPNSGAAGLRKTAVRIFTKKRGVDSPLVLNLQGNAKGRFSGFKDLLLAVDFGTQRHLEKKEPVRFPLQNQLGRTIYVKAYYLAGEDKDDFKLEVDKDCRVDETTKEIEIRVGEKCDLLLSYVAPPVSISHADLVLEAWTRTGDERIPASLARLSGKKVFSILDPDSSKVDFGWMDAGKSSEPKLITLTNQSTKAVRVIPEVSDPELFEVEAPELDNVLPPGGTAHLSVTSHPKEGGEFSGELRLSLEGEEVTDVTIGLKGHAWALDGSGGGCSSGPSAGGPLGVGGLLLLLALGARRRSRKKSP